MDSCPICVNNYSTKIRKKITCPDPQCEFECCVNCVKEYIIVSNNDPKCMKCNKKYNRNFLQETMTKNWLNKKFKDSRKNVLFDREKSLFVNTMPYVNSEITARNHEQENIKIMQEITRLKKQIDNMHLEIELRKDTIYQLRNGMLLEKNTDFKTKCPTCEGFVNKNMICNICNIKICKYCQDIISKDEIILKPLINQSNDSSNDSSENQNEEIEIFEEIENDEAKCNKKYHICDRNKLESANLIKKECKPCPKCGTPIHKIDGCDQMWDPQCGTAFSWNTGHILTGVIHNPHYFEYMRENGNLPRQPGDIPCGDDPEIRDLNLVFCWLPTLWKFNRIKNNISLELLNSLEKRYYIVNSIRILYHVRHIEIIHNLEQYMIENNQKDRVKFLLKEISEEEYKKNLFNREKQHEKNIEINQVWETFANVLKDILKNYIETYRRKKIPSKPEDENNWISVTEFFNTDTSTWWHDHLFDKQPLCKIGNSRVYYDPSDVFIPNDKNILNIFNEIKSIETYCNNQFNKIRESYNLNTPFINIMNDEIIYK